jgi:hypothetical protein
VNTGYSVPRTSSRVLERIEEALGSLALNCSLYSPLSTKTNIKPWQDKASPVYLYKTIQKQSYL